MSFLNDRLLDTDLYEGSIDQARGWFEPFASVCTGCADGRGRKVWKIAMFRLGPCEPKANTS